MAFKLLNKSISVKIILIYLIITNLITYLIVSRLDFIKSDKKITEIDSQLNYSTNCSYKVKRLSGFNFVNPILFIDDNCESQDLSQIKQNITVLIDNYKKSGIINSASLYLKEFDNNGWIGINSDEKFHPGSLMKIPILITFLKKEESNPGYLNQVVTFDKALDMGKKIQYKSKKIVLGNKYSYNELLNYMIAYSDNDATTLLCSKMDLNQYRKVFSDIGLVPPDLNKLTYNMSSREVSCFMRVIYNASYLNNKNVEYATELLQKCDFKEGIVSAIPKSINVAHKFGESGDQVTQELNETAIV